MNTRIFIALPKGDPSFDPRQQLLLAPFHRKYTDRARVLNKFRVRFRFRFKNKIRVKHRVGSRDKVRIRVMKGNYPEAIVAVACVVQPFISSQFLQLFEIKSVCS